MCTKSEFEKQEKYYKIHFTVFEQNMSFHSFYTYQEFLFFFLRVLARQFDEYFSILSFLRVRIYAPPQFHIFNHSYEYSLRATLDEFFYNIKLLNQIVISKDVRFPFDKNALQMVNHKLIVLLIHLQVFSYQLKDETADDAPLIHTH